MTTSKHGLYPEHFASALRRHYQLALRSEQHQNFDSLFVDNGQLNLLDRGDWQVVFGRRGTGKTLLLGAQREKLLSALATERILPVVVSAQDCLVSPVGREVSDETRALAYFQELLRIITKQLLDHVDNLLQKETWLDRLTGHRATTLDRIATLTLEVMNAAEYGELVVPYANITKKNTLTERAASKRSGGIGLGIKVDAKGPSGSFDVHGSAEGSRSSDEEAIVNIEGAGTPRFPHIRQLLTELLELLDVERLLIHIDEWSVFDPTASTLIQPTVAEYIKRTFSGSPRFSIKIATNKYQTKFNNRAGGRESKGLELGADIFVATNLDAAFSSERHLCEFYRKLLYRRLVFQEHFLSIFEHESLPGEPTDGFLGCMFQNERAFEALVRGAQGVPRDFIILFNELCRMSGFSTARLWTVEQVRECVRKKSIDATHAHVEVQSEADRILLGCIRPIAERTGSRLFLVARKEPGWVHESIEELLEKRLVHEVDPGVLQPATRTANTAFLLDYGLWLDWYRPRRRTDADEDTFAGLSGEEAKLVIITNGIQPDQIVACPHCQARFPADAKCYVLRQLCASCFLPVRGAEAPAPARSAPALVPPEPTQKLAPSLRAENKQN